MLKEQLTELINTLYEAEGLVDMALRRDVATDDRVLYLALAKCHDVSRKAAEIKVDKPAEQAEQTEGDVPVYPSAPATPAPAAPAAEETVHEAVAEALDDEEPEKEVEVFTNEVLPKIEAASMPVDDISDASIFDNDDDDATPEMTDLPDASNATPAEDYPAPARERAVVAERKPIIKAFSINDKYRYRRTLFDDNDMQMRDTLAEFEGMADYNEAVDYCGQTLGWDIESGEAKGFVAILDKYYNS